jgi:hypothetical protein
MIDLSKEQRQRQSSIWVAGVEYPIKTEFYLWINFEKQIVGKSVTLDMLDQFDCLYQWRVPEDREAGFKELIRFYENRQPLPRPSGKPSNVIAFDYELDSEYVYAAFLQQYGINLIEQSVHWHDFLSLFNGLVDTKLSQIISARYDTSKPGADMRRAWEILKEVSPEEMPQMKKPKRKEKTNG